MNKHTNVRIPLHLVSQLEARAANESTSVGSVITKAIEQFLQAGDPVTARLDGIARQIADGNETLAMKLATENRTLLTQLGDLVELIVTNQPGATKPDYTNLRK